MLGGMTRRLDRLERRRAGLAAPAARWPLMVWNMCPLPNESTRNLVGNERIDHDWYRDVCGIVSTRERITTDPEDKVRKCEPGGYLADVLQEIHRDCAYRSVGCCRACAGTPVSEPSPKPPGATAEPLP